MIKRQKLSHILHPSFTHDLLSPIYHQAPPCWAILKTPPGLPLWIGDRAGLGTNLHWIAIGANHAAAGLSPKVEPWNGETYSCGQKMRMGDPHASCCRCQLLPASYSTKGSSVPIRGYNPSLFQWSLVDPPFSLQNSGNQLLNWLFGVHIQNCFSGDKLVFSLDVMACSQWRVWHGL